MVDPVKIADPNMIGQLYQVPPASQVVEHPSEGVYVDSIKKRDGTTTGFAAVAEDYVTKNQFVFSLTMKKIGKVAEAAFHALGIPVLGECCSRLQGAAIGFISFSSISNTLRAFHQVQVLWCHKGDSEAVRSIKGDLSYHQACTREGLNLVGQFVYLTSLIAVVVKPLSSWVFTAIDIGDGFTNVVAIIDAFGNLKKLFLILTAMHKINEIAEHTHATTFGGQAVQQAKESDVPAQSIDPALRQQWIQQNLMSKNIYPVECNIAEYRVYFKQECNRLLIDFTKNMLKFGLGFITLYTGQYKVLSAALTVIPMIAVFFYENSYMTHAKDTNVGTIKINGVVNGNYDPVADYLHQMGQKVTATTQHARTYLEQRFAEWRLPNFAHVHAT